MAVSKGKSLRKKKGATVPRLGRAQRVNEQRPCSFPFYGEDAGRLFTIYHNVMQTCCNRPTHDPHVTHSTLVVGKRNWRGSYCGKTPPRIPAHRSGPGPITLRAYMWPRPGGSCRCTKVGVLFVPIYLCTCSRNNTPAATLGGAKEAKTQDYQSSAKPKAREAEGQGGLSPTRALPGKFA